MNTKRFTMALLMLIVLISTPLFGQNRIVDNAGFLSVEEKARLEGMMAELASAYNFDFIILTEKTIGSLDPEYANKYSWNYLDNRGLGGHTWDGCLLLSVDGMPGNQLFSFTASGRGSNILNPAAYDRLELDVRSRLTNGNYAGAYEAFINNWGYFLTLESKGRTYNKLHSTKTHLISLAIAWVVSLLIGSIVVGVWKAQMNNVIPQSRADRYVVPGSVAFTRQSDKFLYSTVTKTKKQSSSSGGSSMSGGGRSSRSGRY